MLSLEKIEISLRSLSIFLALSFGITTFLPPQGFFKIYLQSTA